jgi:hypothetical protein
VTPTSIHLTAPFAALSKFEADCASRLVHINQRWRSTESNVVIVIDGFACSVDGDEAVVLIRTEGGVMLYAIKQASFLATRSDARSIQPRYILED